MKNLIILLALNLTLSVSVIAQGPKPEISASTNLPVLETVKTGVQPSEIEKKVIPETNNGDLAETGFGFEEFTESKQTGQDDSGRNKFELYTGYSGASLFADAFESVESGFNVSGVYYFHRFIGVKVDGSGTYKKFGFGINSGDHSLYNLTAGVQFKETSKDTRWKPFVHGLVGVANHTDTYGNPVGTPVDFDFTGFSTIIGGGLDIKVHRRIDIRAFQADLNLISYKSQPFGNSSNYSNVRFGAGVVFNF